MVAAIGLTTAIVANSFLTGLELMKVDHSVRAE